MRMYIVHARMHAQWASCHLGLACETHCHVSEGRSVGHCEFSGSRHACQRSHKCADGALSCSAPGPARAAGMEADALMHREPSAAQERGSARADAGGENADPNRPALTPAREAKPSRIPLVPASKARSDAGGGSRPGSRGTSPVCGR